MKKSTIVAPLKSAKKKLTLDDMQRAGEAIAAANRKAKSAAAAASAKKKGKPLPMK